MPSFPCSFQDSEIANPCESMVENNGRNGDVSEFFTLLLFTQFFMSDAADSFLPLPIPFYSGLNSVGCVLNPERLRGKSQELFGGREGRRADESDGDFCVEVKSEL